MTPVVVFQPSTYRGMQNGINQLVEAVRPTLGPLPRVVAIERVRHDQAPELLDSGGVIARRILELPDRDADMGAMFLRHLLWQMHEEVGDGTVTTAVLFQAIYNQGIRYVVSGGNAMLLRRYLEAGMHLILNQLNGLAVPLEGQTKLAQMAESICYELRLAEMLGEIFDFIGEYGRLDLRTGRTQTLEREYIEGSYWDGGLLVREMINDHAKQRVELTNASILISDLDLEDPHELLPVLAMAKQAGIHNLLIVANKLADSVTALLHSASREPEQFLVIAAKMPGKTFTDQVEALADLGILTGGRPLVKAAGDTLRGVTLADLGQARRAWADRNYLGLIRGKGDPRALRSHVASLRAAFGGAADLNTRQRLQQRLGKLMSGSAVLWVGGATGPELEMRKAMAERTAAALRGAVREGLVPGGGVALLACRPTLQQKLDQSATADERAAYHILLASLEAPIRTILSNAGYEASEVMAQIYRASAGYGFDVRSGQVVEMAQAGIWDAAAVVKAAVRGAISHAALALTTDVLVHHKTPQQSVQP